MVRPNGTGNAKVSVVGKGANLGFHANQPLPLAQSPQVTVQLRTTAGTCWEATFHAPAAKGDAGQFVDRSD